MRCQFSPARRRSRAPSGRRLPHEARRRVWRPRCRRGEHVHGPVHFHVARGDETPSGGGDEASTVLGRQCNRLRRARASAASVHEAEGADGPFSAHVGHSALCEISADSAEPADEDGPGAAVRQRTKLAMRPPRKPGQRRWQHDLSTIERCARAPHGRVVVGDSLEEGGRGCVRRVGPHELRLQRTHDGRAPRRRLASRHPRRASAAARKHRGRGANSPTPRRPPFRRTSRQRRRPPSDLPRCMGRRDAHAGGRARARHHDLSSSYMSLRRGAWCRVSDGSRAVVACATTHCPAPRTARRRRAARGPRRAEPEDALYFLRRRRIRCA